MYVKKEFVRKHNFCLILHLSAALTKTTNITSSGQNSFMFVDGVVSVSVQCFDALGTLRSISICRQYI